MHQTDIPTKNVPARPHPPPLLLFFDPGGVPKCNFALQRTGPTVISAAMAKKSNVNAAGNYTKPEMRKSLYQQIKAQATHGTKAGQWSGRKAQLLAKKYKEKGGGYRD